VGGVVLLESGREIEGPRQEFNRMTQREYKELLEQRDEKERQIAERLKYERELLEKRRTKQIERATILASIQKNMKINIGVSVKQLYEEHQDNAKSIVIFRPSKLPIRNIKTADSKQRKLEDKRLEVGKVYKYNDSIIYNDNIEKHKNTKPESVADEFNKNILAEDGLGDAKSAGKGDSRPATARERNFVLRVKGPRSGIGDSRHKRYVKRSQMIKLSEQRKFLPPPPLGKTTGHGLIIPHKGTTNKNAKQP